MKKTEDNQKQIPEPGENEVDPSELSEEELDETSGGIIIVSGKPVFSQTKIGSGLEKVVLNPQPLPPKIFKIGGH